MAYIVNLTNVLDILLTLTSCRNQENLTIRTIKVALMTYYKSIRNHVHTQIRECSVEIFGSSGVAAGIESLKLSRRYDINDELVKAIEMIAPEHLERGSLVALQMIAVYSPPHNSCIFANPSFTAIFWLCP